MLQCVCSWEANEREFAVNVVCPINNGVDSRQRSASVSHDGNCLTLTHIRKSFSGVQRNVCCNRYYERTVVAVRGLVSNKRVKTAARVTTASVALSQHARQHNDLTSQRKHFIVLIVWSLFDISWRAGPSTLTLCPFWSEPFTAQFCAWTRGFSNPVNAS